VDLGNLTDQHAHRVPEADAVEWAEVGIHDEHGVHQNLLIHVGMGLERTACSH
jgi:hypothetical protein